MESGPSRVNAPLEGPVIPRSRRNLFKDQSFADSYNAGTKADMWHAGGTLQAKERGRWSAPGMVQCRGTGRWGTVVSVCLVPEGGIMTREGRGN
jgi:hypothetical protein